MKRLGAVVAVAIVAFIAAIVVFNTPGKKGCPLTGDEDASYASRFVGPVSMEETQHDLKLTRAGSPLKGAKVCINTEMVGMSGMGYSVKGTEVGPGRYRVGFRFEMAGKYRGNLVADEAGRQVSIPFLISVAPRSKRLRGER